MDNTETNHPPSSHHHSPFLSSQGQVEVERACKEVIVKILLEAGRLLQGNGWNKFSMARDVSGKRCGPDSNEASCFCLSGALVKAWRVLDPSHEIFYFKFFEEKFSEVLRTKYNYNYTYTRWNDRVATSKEDVLALIHCVIASVLENEARMDLARDSLVENSKLAATPAFFPAADPAPAAALGVPS
jgi:hypothetical protein